MHNIYPCVIGLTCCYRRVRVNLVSQLNSNSTLRYSFTNPCSTNPMLSLHCSHSSLLKIIISKTSKTLKCSDHR